MRFLDIILEVVFPAKCFACGKPGADLCFLCLSSFPEAERESAPWIFPLYDYRDPHIKKSLWLLKYKGKKRLARVFAETMYDKIMEELGDLRLFENFQDPILIPVPLSRKRYRERGFNQAELICRELGQIDSLRHPPERPCRAGGVNGQKHFYTENNILIKPKETEHQAHIKNRSRRLRNISGSFRVVDGMRIKGRNIILIDDILTTGATLAEARKVLRSAGARHIVAFTVAH